MAVVTGTITNVFNFTNPLGPVQDATGKEVRCAFVTVNVTGTYAQADNAQILTVNTALQNLIRDGKTVGRIIDVALAQPGDEAGTLIGVNTLAISTFTLTFQLCGSDLITTEHAGAALGTLNRDICIFISYTVS
jgi:hypothetical protein